MNQEIAQALWDKLDEDQRQRLREHADKPLPDDLVALLVDGGLPVWTHAAISDTPVPGPPWMPGPMRELIRGLG